jgi:hypothetical protein
LGFGLFRRAYVLSGRRPKPDVRNLKESHRRMRLYRCRLDIRACHPAENLDRVTPFEVSKPRSRVSREHGTDCSLPRRKQVELRIEGTIRVNWATARSHRPAGMIIGSDTRHLLICLRGAGSLSLSSTVQRSNPLRWRLCLQRGKRSEILGHQRAASICDNRELAPMIARVLPTLNQRDCF